MPYRYPSINQQIPAKSLLRKPKLLKNSVKTARKEKIINKKKRKIKERHRDIKNIGKRRKPSVKKTDNN